MMKKKNILNYIKVKKNDIINLLIKWKKYKKHILQYHEICSENISLKDDLINSINQYPFQNLYYKL